MAKTNLGRVVPLHMGIYNAETTYSLNHLVSYNGSLYWHRSREDTKGILPTDESVWIQVTDMSDAEQYIVRAETAARESEAAQTAAETAEINALHHKEAAEAAVEDAQTAQTAAENAQEGAESAQLAAAGSAATAQQYEVDANSHMEDARIAKEGAEAARDEAVRAKGTATQAATDSLTAQSNAEAARDEAVRAKGEASTASTTATNAKNAAESAQLAAESAKEDALASKDAAEISEANAKTYMEDAEKSYNDAVTKAQEAEASADRAEAAALRTYKRYITRWDKVNAQMVRFGDAADITTDTTNFAYKGSVNAAYNNPFDGIYPWSGRRLCNIDIARYRALTAGSSLKECVTAWEGEPGFSYDNQYGVWVYTPEFWGDAWEDGTYRWFEVCDREVSGKMYFPESIGGRWHGVITTLTIDGSDKTCLLPLLGMPGKRVAMSTLHTYAKNWGASIDNIYQYNASSLLYLVEYGHFNSQTQLGDGVSSLYRENAADLIQEASTGNVVKVLASIGAAYCIPGAIFDIGTSNGGNQVGSFQIMSVETSGTLLNVTLDREVTVTTANFWSVHGLCNQANPEIGSKSGYIGTNGKSIAYYRGEEFFGNLWRYILGAYHKATTNKIFICENEKLCDNYDAINTAVHKDTGVVIAATNNYIKQLGFVRNEAMLCIPACTEVGGSSSAPVGDSHYNSPGSNTVLFAGGYASSGPNAGRFCGYWYYTASISYWYCAARPLLKSP